MDNSGILYNRILIVGDCELAFSIADNILNGGQEVLLSTSDWRAAQSFIGKLHKPAVGRLQLLDDWPDLIPCDLAIMITREDMDIKKQVIGELSTHLPENVLIAINTESVSLEELQEDADRSERIIGLNWCYPAHLTFFMEIITNAETDVELVAKLDRMARASWGKDPYTVRDGFSTRARMMAAWAREAIYLVENGFASMESVDRACRNDAGYYLPFAGNFRYMDLMGTYAYGMVMKDLNPDLSKSTHVPENLSCNLDNYAASLSDINDEDFLRFTDEIRNLILKYAHETFDS